MNQGTEPEKFDFTLTPEQREQLKKFDAEWREHEMRMHYIMSCELAKSKDMLLKY